MESYAPYVVDLIFYITRARVYGHARAVSLSLIDSMVVMSLMSLLSLVWGYRNMALLSRAVPWVCMHSRAHVCVCVVGDTAVCVVVHCVVA